VAGETIVTVVGNLAGDPELRFTPSGAAVANFTVASTPRTFDRQSQEWKDGETLWMRCSVWREQAENAAESLTKGTRVVVTGRLTQRSWDDEKSGQKRTAVELQVDEVAPSLRYAQATVRKIARGNSGGGGGQQYTAPDRDPWATPAAATTGSGGHGPYDEPPFAHATGYDLALQRGDAVVV
jgi:single-strand DNA-binding protein